MKKIKINREQITARFIAVLLAAFYLMRRLFVKLSRLALRHKPLTSIIVVSFVLLSSVLYVRLTSAATYIMVPNSDISNNWGEFIGGQDGTCSGGTYCDFIDEGIAPNDADRLATINDQATGTIMEYGLTAPMNVSTATQVVITARLQSSLIGSAPDTVGIALRVNGTLQTITTVTMTSTMTNYTVTYNGSWSQADVDSMQVYFIRNIEGSGKASNQDDTVILSNTYATLTYTSASTTEQSAYRWYQNNPAATASDTFSKLPDITTNFSGTSTDRDWSSVDTYLAAAATTSPFVSIFKRSGDTFTKLADPASLPTGQGRDVDFSSDDAYLGVAHYTSPYLTIYKRSGDSFTKLADPAALPNGEAEGVSFSSDTIYVAVSHETSPYLTIYKRSGDTFTKLADPATSPTSRGNKVTWSPDGVYLSVVHAAAPYLTIYKRSGDTFTKLADPAALPGGTANAVSWSPDGNHMAVAHEVSPYMSIYSRSGDTFTRLSDPATIPTGVGYSSSYSPDGQFLSIGHANSPYFTIYSRSGDVYTKLANPSTLIPGPGFGVSFSSSSVYMSVGHSISPGMSIYKSGTTANISTPLAATNTAATSPSTGTTYRLRMNLHIGTAELAASGGSYKLRYAPKGSGACSAVAGTSYSDVTGTSPIRYAYNPNLTSGMGLTPSANDPSHSGHTLVHQSYLEAGTTTFTNSTAIPAGQDGVWDFALATTVSAAPGSYCFKITTSTGTDLNTYTQYPELTVPATAILGQKDYRFYQNQDSTTPGTPLAAPNTSATLGSDGENFRLRNTLGISVKFEQVSSGYTYACGLTGDGKAYCWGYNGGSQLGNGNTGTASNVPVPVSVEGLLAGKTIKRISAGATHACAIASDNQAYCWGDNNSGQLGNGNTGTDSNVPVAVSTSGVLAGKTIKDISAGGVTTCAIASDDQAYCWGNNGFGQLGNGNTGAASNVPVPVSVEGLLAGKTIKRISADASHACAIASDDQVYCWGDNSVGQLGNGNTGTASNVPVAVSTSGVLAGKTIVKISLGHRDDGYAYNPTTCAIASDNQAYCWGDNNSGQLGNGNTGTDSNVPVAVSTSGVLAGKTIKDISAGGVTTCAIASDDQAYCWGNNGFGQLGNGNTGAASNVPVPVSTSGVLAGKSITSISVSAAWPTEGLVCVIASDNQAYCWGDNVQGQLGNGNTGTDSNVPVAVSTDQLFNTPMLSVDGLCTVASNGNGYCWGNNSWGELGNGITGTDSYVPVTVDTSGSMAGKTFQSIVSGISHRCGIASDQLAYCWGKDDYGQRGDSGPAANSNVPLPITMSGALVGKTINQIDAGQSNACIIASDNLGYCWGTGAAGQIGGGSFFISVTSPNAVSTSGVLSGKTLKNITVGGNTTCVIASDDLAYCWGDNVAGELGNGNTGTDSNVPVAVSTAGVLSGKTIKSISAGANLTCVIASDNQAYCWGTGYKLGDGGNTASNVPVAVFTGGAFFGKTILSISASHDAAVCAIASDNQVYCWGNNLNGDLGNGTSGGVINEPGAIVTDAWALSIPSNLLSARLQFAEKGTALTCSAVTGYSDITTTSAIAYADNSSLTNAATISTHANDPKVSTATTVQTYHETNTPDITNPYSISAGKFAMWDYSLKDLSAPSNSTYCLRLAGSDGSQLLSYSYFPEFTTASTAPTGPTLDQQMRGGQGVVNGIKNFFSW